MFFARKSAEVRISDVFAPNRNTSRTFSSADLLIRKMSALERNPDCGRLLWTVPNFSLILFIIIFWAKLDYVKIESAKLVAFDRVT